MASVSPRRPQTKIPTSRYGEVLQSAEWISASGNTTLKFHKLPEKGMGEKQNKTKQKTLNFKIITSFTGNCDGCKVVSLNFLYWLLLI